MGVGGTTPYFLIQAKHHVVWMGAGQATHQPDLEVHS